MSELLRFTIDRISLLLSLNKNEGGMRHWVSMESFYIES